MVSRARWRGPSEPGEFPTLGWLVIDWIESFLIVPGGAQRGAPLVLTDEQARHVLHRYRLRRDARVHPKYPRPIEGRVYHGAQLRRPQKWGKDPLAAALDIAAALGPVQFDGWDASGDPVGRPVSAPWVQVAATSDEQPLALGTRVRTSNGWSTVGELAVGDHVFGPDGLPRSVQRVTDVLLGEPCYRVRFDDGTEIAASAGHGWTLDRATSHHGRYEQVTTTTAEIAATVRTRQGGKRYRIPTAGIDTPAVKLPMDPWLLGLWLGDGATDDATIAADTRLRGEYEALLKPLMREHEELVWRDHAGNQATVRIRRARDICPRGHRSHRGTGKPCRTCQRMPTATRQAAAVLPSMREVLRDLGVLGSKRVPQQYLLAGTQQRRALLQGMVDSDGMVTTKGEVIFTNVNRLLIDQFVELAHGLGYRTLITPVYGGRGWRARFHPGAEPCARLSAKVARQMPHTSRGRSQHRWIESVEPVPSVPVRCIGLDDADHLFQVGPGVLTHNTDNTYQPLYRMLSEGPLADTPGLDIGETRIKLPDGEGWIEPVTAAARSRLGAPITHASFTEPHLMRKRDGGLELTRAMKRNLAGMGGDWGEYTNAWDPSEESAAQLTAQAKAPGVYLDHANAELPRLTGEQFDDDKVVLERIVIKYGDSCRKNGGWVDERSILATIRDSATGEVEARRYFLDEVTVGERDAVNALQWAALARPVAEHGALEPREPVALGFDGSRYRDATALMACRISDGRWFTLGVWVPDQYRTAEQEAANQPGKVPEDLVERAMDDAFAAYDAWYMIADPYRWQTVLDRKAGAWGDNPARKPIVIDFPTNVERRMDDAITLWATAFRAGEGEFTHDGDPTVTKHALNSAIALGGRKAVREDEDAQLEDRYKKLAKKKPGWLIDGFVAGVLSTYGRGLAIEHGALTTSAAPNLW